jgi:mannan endo-1,4-beta-mannosidase
VQAVYHMPSVLSRGDPQIANALAAIRKPSAGVSDVSPVTPDAASGVKTLLSQLYSVDGSSILSGQQNAGQTAATAHVFEVTAKYPSIYGQDLADFQDPSALVDEAKNRFRSHAIVSLSWHAPRPTDGKSAGGPNDQLTDYEWTELLTPGSKLYERWAEQVDAAAETLKKLQDAGIPVLWRPYPENNGKNFWWAGRKGNRGSVALYRQLFDRMLNHDGVRNLVWVWTAAPPGFGPNANGSLFDFFPGLLYADALSLKDPQLSWRADASLASMAVGKPFGVELSAVPKPEIAQQKWSWFLLAADPAPTPEKDQALRLLYVDPKVVARSESQTKTDAAK